MMFAKLNRWLGLALVISVAFWLVGGPASKFLAQAQDCSVSFSLSPSKGTAQPGGTTQFTIMGTAQQGACNWIFTPTFSPDNDISMTFDPSSAVISPGQTVTSQATVSVGANTPPGIYELSIVITLVKQSPPGYFPEPQPPVTKIFTLQVGPGGRPDLRVNPSSIDFGTVNVGQSAQRQLTISNFGQADLFVNSVTIQGGPSSVFSLGVVFTGFTLRPNQAATITIFCSPRASGTFQDNLIIRSNDPAKSTMAVPLRCSGISPFDFDLTVTPGSQSVVAGASTSYTVRVTLRSGTAQSVQLSVSGLPLGAGRTFSPSSVTPSESSTLTISTTSGTAPGRYDFTVSGSGGGRTKNASATLIVRDNFDFSLSASPTLRQVEAGRSVSYDVTATLLSGQAQPVTLTVTGLPRDVRTSFSASTVVPRPSGATSSLRIDTGTTTPAGIYEMTISGTSLGGIETGGTVIRTTRITLTVQQTFVISGFKFEDLNGNGIWDKDREQGLDGWKITLQGPGGPRETTTKDGGRFEFMVTRPTSGEDKYTLSEESRAGWVQTAPQCSNRAAGSCTVTRTVRPADATNVDEGPVLFGNQRAQLPPIIILGCEFRDLNRNGQRDLGEPGLHLWEISLTGPESGKTITDITGCFMFTVQTSGVYTVAEEHRQGWVPTTPTSVTVKVPEAVPELIWFGNDVDP
ncbi:choice-of-anchor D domain-containing protein [Candidatus Acetothermia bacterium]|nr:choice-of-anchor D domain-containing protein [Candidatus Acetothermia bacterium]